MYLTEVPLVFWTGDLALCGGLADSLFRPPIYEQAGALNLIG